MHLFLMRFNYGKLLQFYKLKQFPAVKVYIYVSKYEKGGETYGGAHRSKLLARIIITAEEV